MAVVLPPAFVPSFDAAPGASALVAVTAVFAAASASAPFLPVDASLARCQKERCSFSATAEDSVTEPPGLTVGWAAPMLLPWPAGTDPSAVPNLVIRRARSSAEPLKTPRRIWLIASSSEAPFRTLTGNLSTAFSVLPRNLRTPPRASLIGFRTFSRIMSVNDLPKTPFMESFSCAPMPLTLSQSGPLTHSFRRRHCSFASVTNGSRTPFSGANTSSLKKVLVPSHISPTLFLSGCQISSSTNFLAGSTTRSTKPLVSFSGSP